jgi:hypothetical protein
VHASNWEGEKAKAFIRREWTGMHVNKKYGRGRRAHFELRVAGHAISFPFVRPFSGGFEA